MTALENLPRKKNEIQGEIDSELKSLGFQKRKRFRLGDDGELVFDEDISVENSGDKILPTEEPKKKKRGDNRQLGLAQAYAEMNRMRKMIYRLSHRISDYSNGTIYATKSQGYETGTSYKVLEYAPGEFLDLGPLEIAVEEENGETKVAIHIGVGIFFKEFLDDNSTTDTRIACYMLVSPEAKLAIDEGKNITLVSADGKVTLTKDNSEGDGNSGNRWILNKPDGMTKAEFDSHFVRKDWWNKTIFSLSQS